MAEAEAPVLDGRLEHHTRETAAPVGRIGEHEADHPERQRDAVGARLHAADERVGHDRTRGLGARDDVLGPDTGTGTPTQA